MAPDATNYQPPTTNYLPPTTNYQLPTAMNNEANFAKIGAFILFGFALITGTLVYLGGMGGREKRFYVETYFPTSVSGLDVGSEVNYRGVKLGAVEKISFIAAEYDNVPPKDGHHIYVLMALDSERCRRSQNETPEKTMARMISNGLHATVTASGITGLSRIEMNFPKMDIPDMKLTWKPRNLFIHPAPSILDSAADSLTKVIGQLNQMDLVAALSNIVRAAKSAGDVCETVDSLVDSERDRVGRILENLDGATSSLRAFSETISDNPSLLIRSRDAKPLPETSAK